VDHTTAAIQGYLDQLSGLKGDAPAEPVVRALIERAAGRLELLCGTLLVRSYPRLTRPPLNLHSEELLSAVVERLLKAMREARPGNVRQFFAIANQHMRWELNDLARRLDEQTPAVPIPDGLAVMDSTGSQISPVARRLFQAIEDLPEEEQEVFSLLHVQGLTRGEAAEILGVSVKTVQRRANRAVLLLSQSVGDLRPVGVPPREE
jgi:RNA polymerase sigma-70 factor (ECF subfamily)